MPNHGCWRRASPIAFELLDCWLSGSRGPGSGSACLITSLACDPVLVVLLRSGRLLDSSRTTLGGQGCAAGNKSKLRSWVAAAHRSPRPSSLLVLNTTTSIMSRSISRDGVLEARPHPDEGRPIE